MKITGEMLKNYSEIFISNERAERRQLFYNMHLMYEGGGRSLIEAKIQAEFKDQDAVKELSGRLVTLNFMKKIIDKSAGVYTEAPSRVVVDENEMDEDLLEIYEDGLRVNMIQKEINRHLKMYKRAMKKFYADEKGRPRLLVKPAHSYEVFNHQNTDPVSPDIVVELEQYANDPKDMILHWWSDESFWITDGKGEVKMDEMLSLGNTGENDIGALPFEYRVTSTTEIDPIVEDDLYYLCIAMPIVLTDLYFALKYQCWSIIYTVNADPKNVNVNPASIMHLKGDPGQQVEVGQIKPQVDSDKVINLIEATINLMLSSKGLSAGTLSTGQSAKDTVSGVSKMVDNAEVVADKKDQQEIFLVDETDLWDKLAKSMIPYWRRSRLLSSRYNKEFSQDFMVAIVFKEPKTLMSEKERTEISLMQMKGGVKTRRSVVQELNPDWTDTMVENYLAELDEEAAAAQQRAVENAKAMAEAVPPKPDPFSANNTQKKVVKKKKGE